jgi:hypothetical protein
MFLGLIRGDGTDIQESLHTVCGAKISNSQSFTGGSFRCETAVIIVCLSTSAFPCPHSEYGVQSFVLLLSPYLYTPPLTKQRKKPICTFIGIFVLGVYFNFRVTK